MSVYVIAFPPSKNFENYLASFFKKYPDDDPKLLTYSKFCGSKLERICRAGAKGKPLTIAEIERAMVRR